MGRMRKMFLKTFPFFLFICFCFKVAGLHGKYAHTCLLDIDTFTRLLFAIFVNFNITAMAVN